MRIHACGEHGIQGPNSMARGNNLFHVMEGFKEFSRMSSIQRAIDVFQIHIPTPKVHPL